MRGYDRLGMGGYRHRIRRRRSRLSGRLRPARFVGLLVAVATGCAAGGSAESPSSPSSTSSGVIAASPVVTSAASGAGSTVVPEALETAPTTDAPESARPRVLLVGDSTLLAVEAFNAVSGFGGFSGVLDTKSCRTLGIPSCGSKPVPPNTVEAIRSAEGPFDIVVVMAGYDEWWTSFPNSVREVGDQARAQGAETLLVLNYREGVGYVAPDGRTATEAFERNNETLREFEASGEIPELVVADWFGYTSVPEADGLLSDDGIHLTKDGAWAVTDYISRWVAHLSDRPCPRETEPTDAVCENPDVSGVIPDQLIPSN